MFVSFVVQKEEAGMQLASFLVAKMSSFSRRAIKRAIDQGLCTIDNQRERFHHTPVRPFQKIVLCVPDEQKNDLELLYEDEWILAYNKPPGFVCEENQKILRGLLIHRLDKDTSGVLLVAKSQEVKDKFITLFRQKKIEKKYVALVAGRMNKDTGVIENELVPIQSFQGATKYGVGVGGQYACTRYEVMRRWKEATLVLLIPETGRTHQLRVHMSFLGHPIINDPLYGGPLVDGAYRHMLHAKEVVFLHPYGASTNKKLSISAPIPVDLDEVCNSLS